MMAADGYIQLKSSDAEIILLAIQKTLEEASSGPAVVESHDNYLQHRRADIVRTMRDQLITQNMGNENDDVLNYLTSHYLPVDTTNGKDSTTTLEDDYMSSSKQEIRRSMILHNCGYSSKQINLREISDGFTKLFGRERGGALPAAFEEFDADGSGLLDKEEVEIMVHMATTERNDVAAASKQAQVETFVSSLFEHTTHFTAEDLYKKMKETDELVELLEQLSSWEFDLFAVAKMTKSPLTAVGVAAARQVQMFERNDFDADKYERFLAEVEGAYCKNPYHNSLHAADVVQTCLHFLTKGQIMEASGISALATAGLLISAAVHDVGHPGSNNHFLISTSAPLAIQYNDHSPLENMHLATAFSIMHKPANNFVDKLSPFMKKELRRIIIAMVLATDNDKHFGMHERLEAVVKAQRAASGLREDEGATEMDEMLITTSARGRKHSAFLLNRDDSTDSLDEEAQSLQRKASFAAIPASYQIRHRASSVSPMVEQAFSHLMSTSVAASSSPSSSSSPTLPRDLSLDTNAELGFFDVTPPAYPASSPSSSTPTPADTQPPPPVPSAPVLPAAPVRRMSARDSPTKQLMVHRSSSITSITNLAQVLSRKNSVPSLDRGDLSEHGRTHAEKPHPTSSSAPSDPTQLLLLESALHMADISNPVKPWDIYQGWLSRVMEEFYLQGDLERQLELPMTFGFDRTNPIPQSKFQLGFIRVIVSPLYTTYSRLPGVSLDHCLASMESNIDRWTLQENGPQPQT